MSLESKTIVPCAERVLRLDILKGAMLLLLMTGHSKAFSPLLKNFLDLTWRPFGFFTMGDGFVIASGITTGLSLVRMGSLGEMWQKIFKRIRRIYIYHLVLSFFSVIAIASYQGPIGMTDPRYYVRLEPALHFFKLALLMYVFPLLDVLPLYLILLLISPPLVRAFQWGKAGIVLAASATVWTLSWKYSPEPALYELSFTFNPFSWQLLFVAGLFYGAVVDGYDRGYTSMRSPVFIMDCLCVLATIYFFCIRHEFAPSFLSPETEDAVLNPRRLLPLGLVANDFVFCRSLRLLSLLHYERWKVLRWLAYVGRESLLVFSWNVFGYYLLAGTNFDFRSYSAFGQGIIYLALMVGSLAPVLIKSALFRSGETHSNNSLLNSH